MGCDMLVQLNLRGCFYKPFLFSIVCGIATGNILSEGCWPRSVLKRGVLSEGSSRQLCNAMVCCLYRHLIFCVHNALVVKRHNEGRQLHLVISGAATIRYMFVDLAMHGPFIGSSCYFTCKV